MKHKFEQLVSANEGRIRFIARRYAYGHEVEDVYQEILLQIWRGLDGFKGAADPSTWLYRVALNTAVSFVRKSISSRKLKEELSALIIKPAHSSDDENCQADILHQFTQLLSDTDAAILMMYLDGLTAEAIADVVGINSGAASKRISRIKQLFEEKYIGDGS